MKDHILPALTLIAVGGTLLLDNLGLLAIDPALLRALFATWWPVALVATGLGMLFSPRVRRAFEDGFRDHADPA